MRISIDLASVHDTSRVLAAAADEYDRAAAALQRGDGLGGVTGPQRYWLTSATESIAGRLRNVAAQHRQTAGDLLRRCECAADNGISPVYAGLAVAGAQVALDRNNDGITDALAIDQNGDGFFETFTLDEQQDGVYDTILISDLSGNLAAAGFDRDQDGHMEGFVGVTPNGALLGTDADRDGSYEFAPLNPPATVTHPGAMLGTAIVGGNSFSDDIHVPSGAFSGPAIIGGHSWSDGIQSGSSGSMILGGPSSATAIISGIVGGVSFSDDIQGPAPDILGTPIVGGVTRPATGPLGGLFGLTPSFSDANANLIKPWFDNPGVRQPELGNYDTYNWMDDPRLDTDNDGIMNNRDSGVRRYDPPDRD